MPTKDRVNSKSKRTSNYLVLYIECIQDHNNHRLEIHNHLLEIFQHSYQPIRHLKKLSTKTFAPLAQALNWLIIRGNYDRQFLIFNIFMRFVSRNYMK